MNRAERRRAKKAGIPVKKEPVVNIKAADVQKIKQDASKEAADKAFLLMLGLPVMVLHDKFGFGPVRCERFTDAVLELYDSVLQNENQIVQPPLLFFILPNDRLQPLIGGGVGIAFTVLPRFSSHDLSTSHLKQ